MSRVIDMGLLRRDAPVPLQAQLAGFRRPQASVRRVLSKATFIFDVTKAEQMTNTAPILQPAPAAAEGDGGYATTLIRGSIRLDAAAFRAWGSAGELALTRSEFELLRYLMRQSDRVVPHQELVRSMTSGAHDPTRSALRIPLSGLRRKLGADGSAIRTIRGLGLRFEPDHAAGGDVGAGTYSRK